jgi:hypothetical protein
MAENQWQPIATAPKDGTRVLIFSNGYPNIAHYVEDFISHRDRWRGPAWVILECDDDDRYTFYCEGDSPSHWAPLPEFPDRSTNDGR